MTNLYDPTVYTDAQIIEHLTMALKQLPYNVHERYSITHLKITSLTKEFLMKLLDNEIDTRRQKLYEIENLKTTLIHLT